MSTLGLDPMVPLGSQESTSEPQASDQRTNPAGEKATSTEEPVAYPPEEERTGHAEPLLETKKPSNEALQEMFGTTEVRLRFETDENTGKTVVRVIDTKTDEVIRQIPPQEMLELASRLEETRSLFFRSKV